MADPEEFKLGHAEGMSRHTAIHELAGAVADTYPVPNGVAFRRGSLCEGTYKDAVYQLPTPVGEYDGGLTIRHTYASGGYFNSSPDGSSQFKGNIGALEKDGNMDEQVLFVNLPRSLFGLTF